MIVQKLTIQEEEAMRCVWAVGQGFIKDYLAQYADPKPPYTTLASIMKNLERKGYVKGRKYGNTFEYQALIEECDYKRRFMSGFVKDYFENSYRDLVAFFIKEQELSKEELKELVNMIEHKELNR